MKKFIEVINAKVKSLLEQGEATRDRPANFKLVVFALLLTAGCCVLYYVITAIL